MKVCIWHDHLYSAQWKVTLSLICRFFSLQKWFSRLLETISEDVMNRNDQLKVQMLGLTTDTI